MLRMPRRSVNGFLVHRSSLFRIGPPSATDVSGRRLRAARDGPSARSPSGSIPGPARSRVASPRGRRAQETRRQGRSARARRWCAKRRAESNAMTRGNRVARGATRTRRVRGTRCARDDDASAKRRSRAFGLKRPNSGFFEDSENLSRHLFRASCRVRALRRKSSRSTTKPSREPAGRSPSVQRQTDQYLPGSCRFQKVSSTDYPQAVDKCAFTPATEHRFRRKRARCARAGCSLAIRTRWITGGRG